MTINIEKEKQVFKELLLPVETSTAKTSLSRQTTKMKAIATLSVLLILVPTALLAQGDKDGSSPSKAAKSCFHIYRYNPKLLSGTYYVLQKNRWGFYQPGQVYCDMGTRRCGVMGGWMPVTKLDMTKYNNYCPPQFKLEVASGKRLCVKTATTGCSGHTYELNGVEYAEVCGMARGYAYGSPDTARIGASRSIEDAYIDGVSITHGSYPRKHIWSYLGGYTENHPNSPLTCPCSKNGLPLKHNSFIGNDFYCESGNPGQWQRKWYLSDPLWDGQGCPAGNSCCSNSGLPYFHRTLPQTTTDDIEVRLCADQPRPDEDIGLERLEIYVR